MRREPSGVGQNCDKWAVQKVFVLVVAEADRKFERGS